MRPNHEVLNHPLHVENDVGQLKVLKKVGKDQSEMGEALTLDGIVNSIDAELVAKGTSAKGPDRGAIVRHGRYTLWAFAGGIDEMTETGKALFVNTVFYAAKHAHSPVLERRLNQTRDGLFKYIELARDKNPGFIRTLAQYLPAEARGKSVGLTERWLEENRPYLRAEGRVFHVDEFAKKMAVPNYRREILQRCIANVREQQEVEESIALLERYTGQIGLGDSAEAWEQWYGENKDYLFFSDTEGSRYLIDEQAKAEGMPTEQLRTWSSEDIDYRVRSITAEASLAAPLPRGDQSSTRALPAMFPLLVAGAAIVLAIAGAGMLWTFRKRCGRS